MQLGVVCVNDIYFSFLRADEFISTNIIKHTSNYYKKEKKKIRYNKTVNDYWPCEFKPSLLVNFFPLSFMQVLLVSIIGAQGC